MLVIRTRRSPFWNSRPSRPLWRAIAVGPRGGRDRPAQPAGSGLLGFAGLPPIYWLLLVGLVAAYLTMVEIAKRIYDRHEDRRLAAAAAIHRPALAARAPAR